MKIYAINGGPRKNWNTDTMLKHFLDGAASVNKNIETEMVYLYNLAYKGCTSCYACQRDDDRTYGQCQVKDDIYDLLRTVPNADCVVFGCPIYFHDLTAELRAFLERLIYQYLSFESPTSSNNAPKRLRIAMIYTMNVTKESMELSNYDHILGTTENYLKDIFGYRPERLCAYNTYQYKDYSKYRAKYWDERGKALYRRIHFGQDCKSAYELGKSMVSDIIKGGK